VTVAPKADTGEAELLALLLLCATALPEPRGGASVAEIETLLNVIGEALVGVKEVALSDPGSIDVVSIVAEMSLLVVSFVVRVTVAKLDGCSVVVLETSVTNVVVALTLTLDGIASETEKLPNAAKGKLVEAEDVVLSAAKAEPVTEAVGVEIELILLVCVPGSSVSLKAAELATIEATVVPGETALLAIPDSGVGEAERLVTATRPVVDIGILPLA